MTWVLFGATLICGFGWLRAELAGKVVCLILERKGIRPTEAEINDATYAVFKRIFNRRK